MAVQLLERYTLSEGDIRRLTIRFSESLDRDEKLTGLPTLTDASGDLVFSSRTLNSAVLRVAGKPTPVNEAVQFAVRQQLVANSPYTIKVSIQTTRGQTLVCEVVLTVE